MTPKEAVETIVRNFMEDAMQQPPGSFTEAQFMRYLLDLPDYIGNLRLRLRSFQSARHTDDADAQSEALHMAFMAVVPVVRCALLLAAHFPELKFVELPKRIPSEEIN